MEFEFDLNKSATNKAKHGIDFIEAQKLWTDVNFTEIPVRTTNR
ncbi:MAG: BrnT family toxin [Nostoc sp.]